MLSNICSGWVSSAWLRNRRSEAPTESEILENLALAQMKKDNAEKLAQKEGKKVDTSEKVLMGRDYHLYIFLLIYSSYFLL